MTRVYGYPMFGGKKRGNKKNQKDLSKLPHILLAIAIFIGKVYLRGSRLPHCRASEPNHIGKIIVFIIELNGPWLP